MSNNFGPPQNYYRNTSQSSSYRQSSDLYDYQTKYGNSSSSEQKSITNLPTWNRQEESVDSRRNIRAIKTSRWSTTKVYIPGLSTHIPYGLTQEEFEAFLVRARLDEVNSRLASEIIIEQCEVRSPSPEAVYDNRGKRTNERDQRIRKALLQERDELYDKAVQKFPNFRAPNETKVEPKKLTKKIYIPYDEYPEYNFVGLIIGPRGVTQKKMERESRAKIAIRGKTGKTGTPYGRDKLKKQEGDDDMLHVFIAADNDKSLKMASDMVEKLLVPVEEGKNELKREQLRELARMHGTLRDEMSSIGGSSVVEFDPMLSVGKVVDTTIHDQAYEEFRSVPGGVVEPQKKIDPNNPYAMYPQFMEAQMEMKTGELPPIIPTIFNLYPTLPIPTGLPESHPWDEENRERDRGDREQY